MELYIVVVKQKYKITSLEVMDFHLDIDVELYDEKRANRSLKGLQYNMTIYGQTNETQCISMAMVETGFSDEIRICSRLYSHTSLPNLVGNPDWNHLRDKVLSAAQYAELLVKMSSHEKYYPYVYELACYVVVPKCEPENGTVVHPCKEMCEELRAGCQENVLAVLKVIVAKQNFFDWMDFSRRDPSTWFNCNYLPSKNGNIPCIYKPVVCQPPPNVTRCCKFDWKWNLSGTINCQLFL